MSNKKYDDIINLPHHVSLTHPHMSRLDRAAQFSPFAALTGYDAAIKETARLTDKKVELGEYELEELNRTLLELSDHISPVSYTHLEWEKVRSKKSEMK